MSNLYICAHAWLFVSLAVCVICCSCLIFILCSVYNSLSCLIVYFLCRLKINHDSHEFILEFGTVVNNTADIPGFLCEWQVSWQTCRFGRQVLWNHWLHVCLCGKCSRMLWDNSTYLWTAWRWMCVVTYMVPQDEIMCSRDAEDYYMCVASALRVPKMRSCVASARDDFVCAAGPYVWLYLCGRYLGPTTPGCSICCA